MYFPAVLATPSVAPSPPSVLDIVDKVVKILAVLIGGFWTYLNYRRGRTFKKRLELTICGKLLQRSSASLLSVSAQLKNVGLSKVPIEQKGTAILIYDLKPSAEASEIANVVETRISVRSVFKLHGWIEPGETIEESFLVQLSESDKRLGIKLELRVVAAHIEWNANAIVELPDTKSTSKQLSNDTNGCGSQSSEKPQIVDHDPQVTKVS